MSRYQSYLDCKESCLPLIGRIPTHWVLTKLKFIGVLKGGAGFPHEEQGNTSEAIDFHKVNALAKANDEGFIEKSENTVSRETAKRLGAYVFPKKSIVFAKVGAALLLSRIRMLKESACIDNNLMGFVVHRQYDVDFIKYAMELIRFDLLVNPGAIPSLNENQIGNYFLVVPTYAEQQKIANFLDHETAKIDTLIAKQQELIKLLKEKRQAVISHAVTKGLNPNAPMRDSGVEWLGDVPAHWKRVPIKHISQIRYGIGEPPTYQEDGVPLIRATNIRSGRISELNLVFVNPKDIPQNRIVWLEKGDIIVVRSGATTGDSSIIPVKYDGCIAGFDMVVRPLRCLSSFLGFALLSNYIRNNQIDIEKTRAAQPHLNAEELGNCFVCLPPADEQIEIVQRIESELSKFDELIAKAELIIQFTQERRTALISAAVTGKIDVRDWQPPVSEAQAV